MSELGFAALNPTYELSIARQKGSMMALGHRAFLLNTDSFRQRLSEVLPALETGDARPLYQQASMVVEQDRTEPWPFVFAGDSLIDIRKENYSGLPWEPWTAASLRNASKIHITDIGYWLLLLLSSCVKRIPEIDVGADYSILDGVLEMLGWKESERQLIFRGTPISAIAGFDMAAADQANRRHYWHRVSPRAYSAGWLSKKQVKKLYRHARREQKAIRTFDHKWFGRSFMGWPLDVPEGQLDYLKRLHFNFAYLFDSNAFRHQVAPLIEGLDNGDYQPLRQKAWAVTLTKPEVWKILENHFYGPDDFLPEYQDAHFPNTRFWFLAILSQYLQAIPSFSPIPTWKDQYLHWELLRRALVLIGWDRRDCTLLISGESTCSLLLPDRVTELVEQKYIAGLTDRSAWLESKSGHMVQAHWCEFEGGWLDKSEMQRLHAKLLESHEDYSTLLTHPEKLGALAEANGESDIEQVRAFLQTSYRNAEEMLTTAKKADKCLFLLIS